MNCFKSFKSFFRKKVDLHSLWGGGWEVHASHPPPYGPVNEFTLLLSKQVSRKKKTCNNIKYFPYLELGTTVAS